MTLTVPIGAKSVNRGDWRGREGGYWGGFDGWAAASSQRMALPKFGQIFPPPIAVAAIHAKGAMVAPKVLKRELNLACGRASGRAGGFEGRVKLTLNLRSNTVN
jgi:hypothetical protein